MFFILGLDAISSKSQSSCNRDSERVETFASRKKKNIQPPEVIVFNDSSKESYNSYKDKKNLKRKVNINHPIDDDEVLQKAKFEVYQLAVSGFHKPEQEEEKVKLAVRLGAKPDKRPCINYKELKKQKVAKALEAEKAREDDKNRGFSFSSKRLDSNDKNSNKKFRRKGKNQKRNQATNVTGQVGKFKDGVLYVKNKY